MERGRGEVIMKIEHQLFAHHYILTGDKDKAYKIAYPTASGEPLKNAARRLIKHPQVRDYINSRMAEVQQHAANTLHAEQKRQEEAEYATVLLKRKVLRTLIDGRQKQPRHFKFKNHVETIEEELNPFVVLRAIELDTKLASEWYNRGAKATTNEPPPEKPKPSVLDFESLCAHQYGPDYLPGLRAEMVRNNPTRLREYEERGLRVLDYVPTRSDYKHMQQEQAQYREQAAAKHEQQQQQTAEPPSLHIAKPPQQPPSPPEAQSSSRTIAVTKRSIPRNKYLRHTGAIPPGVNPMSIPQPSTRLQLSAQQIDHRLHHHHHQLTLNPQSIFYHPPPHTPQNNTG